MYNIRKLNEISPIVTKYLPEDQFAITDNATAPDAILVRSADMQSMELPENLLAVARAGAGVNNINIPACSAQGVVVFNTPGANANAVKELVIAGLLMSGRRIFSGIQWAQSLRGQGAAVPAMVEKGKGQFVGPELAGKTLGIIGLGAIGVLVANAAVGMGMQVVGYDPFLTVESALGLTRAVKRMGSLDELLAVSDYVTVHVPFVEKTRGYINAENIAKMKEGVVLLNFSRAELVDTASVFAALDNHHVRTYVTDFPTDELLSNPGVLCIPHLGASTPESEENCAEMAARQLRNYIRTGSIRNSVNYPECDLSAGFTGRICVLHDNVSGVLGQITAAITERGLNISNMVNTSRGELAYTVIDIDTDLTQDLVDRIRAISTVHRCRLLMAE